jgi:hypothetical protein
MRTGNGSVPYIAYAIMLAAHKAVCPAGERPAWVWNARVVITDGEVGNRLRESSVVKAPTEAGQATDWAVALTELCRPVTYPHGFGWCGRARAELLHNG